MGLLSVQDRLVSFIFPKPSLTQDVQPMNVVLKPYIFSIVLRHPYAVDEENRMPPLVISIRVGMPVHD